LLPNLLLGAVFALGAMGCVSKPTMKLNHAEISGVSFGFPPQVGVVMTVVIDVYNPNSYDVAVRGMRGTALLASRYTMPIDFRPGADGVWIPASSSSAVRVPITVPLDLALRMLNESLANAEVPFRVTGTADVTASRTFQIEKDNYSVDESGTFSRQQLELALPHF
jgi:LEA14-like dessication related protein